jgi:hypothetical protein
MMPGFAESHNIVVPPDGMGLRKFFAEHGHAGTPETSFGFIWHMLTFADTCENCH